MALAVTGQGRADVVGDEVAEPVGEGVREVLPVNDGELLLDELRDWLPVSEADEVVDALGDAEGDASPMSAHPTSTTAARKTLAISLPCILSVHLKLMMSTARIKPKSFDNCQHFL